MDRCLMPGSAFTVSFQILKPIPQKMISLFPWVACAQSHLQRYPFCNCDTFEGFLRARVYSPIHRIIAQKAISTCHCIMNGMQVPWASHKQHIRFFHFIQFSFRHAWWDWQDTCWKAKTSLKVFAFSTSLIRIVFTFSWKYQHSDGMGKSDGKETREKWKACLTFGSRNMMEFKQATALLDLNSDQLQSSSQFLMPIRHYYSQRVSLFLSKRWMLIN